MATRPARVQQPSEVVKHFIVFDGGARSGGGRLAGGVGLMHSIEAGVGSWEDSRYRGIVLQGCTYSEPDLREWAKGSFGTALDAPLADIARAVARGGWIMAEHVAPTPEIECPKCKATDWQTRQPVFFSSEPQGVTLTCKSCGTVRSVE